jgi:multimeric flavodoxin WrbA
MRVIIHDLGNEACKKLHIAMQDGDTVISETGKIHACLGCFGCWIRTPGLCVIQDEYQQTGNLFVRADKIIVISRCCYGGFSPFVKTVFDRSIGCLLPFFKIVEGEMHHTMRAKKKNNLSVYFYGDISEAEQDTASKLVAANAVNLHASHKVNFLRNAEDIGANI